MSWALKDVAADRPNCRRVARTMQRGVGREQGRLDLEVGDGVVFAAGLAEVDQGGAGLAGGEAVEQAFEGFVGGGAWPVPGGGLEVGQHGDFLARDIGSVEHFLDFAEGGGDVEAAVGGGDLVEFGEDSLALKGRSADDRAGGVGQQDEADAVAGPGGLDELGGEAFGLFEAGGRRRPWPAC